MELDFSKKIVGTTIKTIKLLPITKYTISFNYRERDRFLNAYDV